MAAKKPKKKQSIRNSEYYNTQKRFDQLYQDSLHGKRFTQLMDIITSEENIMLAYRSIKKNKAGVKTNVNIKLANIPPIITAAIATFIPSELHNCGIIPAITAIEVIKIIDFLF